MERLDVLVRQVRDQTGNQQYTSTQGIRQREFVRYANDAQMRIYNRILMERSSLFTKAAYIDISANDAIYDLPDDIFLRHNILKVDYSPTGDARLYSPLDLRSPRQEVSAPGYPSCYFLRQGELVLSPIPMQSATSGLRLNYQYTLPTLDIRRARIAEVESGTAPYEWESIDLAAGGAGASTFATCYGNGVFVLAGSLGSIRTSEDQGSTWVTRTSGFGSTTTIRKVLFANNMFIAIGDSSEVSTSIDGLTWVSRTALFEAATGSTTDNLTDVVFGDGRFVVVGANGVAAYTNDGTHWIGINTGFGAITIRSIAYSATLRRYVAVAGSGGTGAARYSPDGQNWTAGAGFSTNQPNNVVCADALGFACGQSTGVVSVSVDGITWTQPATGLAAFDAYVAFGEGRLIGVSTNTAYSDNLTTWSAGTSPAINIAGPATFVGGYFFVQETVGNALLYVSADGATWNTGVYMTGSGPAVPVSDGEVFVLGLNTARYAISRASKFNLTLESTSLLLDETEDDLENSWVDYVCVVSADGEVQRRDLFVNSYNSTTHVLSVNSDEPLGADLEGSYLVFGSYATTHSQLPEVAERYLREFMALRIQMRDSNAESTDTSSVLRALEEEIIESIANLEEDLVAIAILDSSMMNYDEDL